MNKIAIVSKNADLKEKLKEDLSVLNYIVLFPDLAEINDGIANILLLDFISFNEFRKQPFKKDYDLQTLPVLGIIDENDLKNFEFSCGIDDFITPATITDELQLRIKLILWKNYGINTQDIIKIDDLIIDIAQHKVIVDMEPIELTYMEFKLLQFLASNKNRVFSREHILERVWGYDYYGGTRTVDVHVRRLRYKLGATYGQLIGTVRNIGYKFGE